MKKIIACTVLCIQLLILSMSHLNAINPDVASGVWTREKAAHLARATLFYADTAMIETLYAAGSASAAVDILFPSKEGPDRNQFDAVVTNYTASGFNWGDGNHAMRLYQLMYAADPYEAKKKLFSLFEDIFSVNIDAGKNITYKDIYDQHSLIYNNMFGSYETLIKKILFNNGGTGDYAEGAFLDLFNQANPNNPNENYAREILQLFLMGEYKPLEGKDTNDTRNYEEYDVRALARILTGLRSDSITHAITFDPNFHYSGVPLVFLSGALSQLTFPFFNSSTGTVDPVGMRQSINGNNGLTDNTIEYIFAKRSTEISLFLANRLYKFYISDQPIGSDIDTIAAIIRVNNFDIFASVKQVLSLDMMYSDGSMRQIRYKNPLELAMGTIKLFHRDISAGIVSDQNIYDTSLLRRLGWTPYFPGSVFGRDGFDDGLKWASTSSQNAWMTATNYFTYRTSGSGVIDFRGLLGNYRRELTNEIIPIMTSIKNTLTGSVTISDMRLSTVLASGNSGSIDTVSGSTDSGTLDLSGSLIIPQLLSSEIMSQSGSVSTGTTDTGSVVINTDSGVSITGVVVPMSDLIIDPVSSGGVLTTSGAIETNTGVTSSGELQGDTGSVTEVVLNAAPTILNSITSGDIVFSSGTVSFPDFRITTPGGDLIVYSGTYNALTYTLSVSSGSLVGSGSSIDIYSGSIVFDSGSRLTADIITSDDLIRIYETYILQEKHLSTETRALVKGFLETDANGVNIPVTPSSSEYYNRNIRGLLSILLAEPEYVLLRGIDLPPAIDTSASGFLDNISGKLFFIELYGGADYLSSIIPKDEYSTYLDYRTNSTGSIALTGSSLVDIGDFYMNSALAYGSGGTGFKSLFDAGYLKIFNRVGSYKHSQDHDAAGRQISSYSNTTDISSEGVFGHLVSNELDTSHTISLGAKLPNIYRGGHYMNMGGNVILTNPISSSQVYHMDILSRIAQARQYPANTKNLFKDAGRISDIAKLSLSQGGPNGANGDMKNIFRFSKVLMNNNIGRSFYMGGYGGYDTHSDQYTGLNRNLQVISESVTNFFNDVKDTQDVTIVIFSEFGRTNKVNGSLGTDHGDGGGMIVLSSNQQLRNTLQRGTYGNMSIKNSKSNSLGVGIDYRSVYGSIFNSLYGIDASTYFGDGVSLDDDVSLDPNQVSLLSYSYRASGNSVIMNGGFSVSGRNYNSGKSGYTKILSGTGTSILKSTNIKETKKPTNGYAYTFQLNSANQPYYSIDSFSNQYSKISIVGSLTGSSIPRILPNNTRFISQTGSSILPIFQGTVSPTILSGSGIILNSSQSGTLLSLASSKTQIIFSSGVTAVNELTTASGGLNWNGGFILGELINKDYFIPTDASIAPNGNPIQRTNIERIVKIGADTLGIGMKLSKKISIKFLSVPTDDLYRVITSEDGVHWNDVEFPGAEYQRDANQSISIDVDHFSYFALLSNTVTLPAPTCTLSASPDTVHNNTPTSLSWSLQNTQTGILMPGNIGVSASGVMDIIAPLNTTTNYSIMVENNAGNASCSTQVTTTTLPQETPVIGGNMATTSGPGGAGSSRGLEFDICVDGDFSGNQYDGTCEPGNTNDSKNKTIQDKETGDGVDIFGTKNSQYQSRALEELLNDLAKKQSGYQIDARIQQRIYSIALGLWRDLNGGIYDQDNSAKGLISWLKDKKNTAKNTSIRIAIQRIIAVIVGFETLRVSEKIGKNSLSIGEKIDTDAGIVYKYVEAERSVHFRETPLVWFSNILDYLARNTRVIMIADADNGWTQVSYNGVVGYIKSKFLKESTDTDIIKM